MKPNHVQLPDTKKSYAHSYARAGMPALILLLVSCANPPQSDQAGAEQECVYVRVTGSNLPVKECRTAEERAAIAARNREAGEQGVRDIRNLDEFGVESVGAESLP